VFLPSIREALLGKYNILNEDCLNSLNTDSELEIAGSEVPKLLRTSNCVWQTSGIDACFVVPSCTERVLPVEYICVFNIRHNLGVGLE